MCVCGRVRQNMFAEGKCANLLTASRAFAPKARNLGAGANARNFWTVQIHTTHPWRRDTRVARDATVGLAAEEASRRAASFGPNALEETQRNPILVFLGFMWNPLSWVMELAAVVALVVREAVHFLFFVFWFLFSSSFGYDTRMYTSS